MANSFVKAVSTSGTSNNGTIGLGLTIDNGAGTRIAVGDIIVVHCAIDPPTAVTFAKSSGTATISSFATNVTQTGSVAQSASSWCTVTGAGSLVIKVTWSGTGTSDTLSAGVYRGAVAVGQSTKGTGNTGTDVTLSLTTQWANSWVVMVGCSEATTTALTAGTATTVETSVQANPTGTTNDLSSAIGSNEAAIAAGTSTAIHFTQPTGLRWSAIAWELINAYTLAPPAASLTTTLSTPVLNAGLTPTVVNLATTLGTPVLQFPIVPDVAALTTAMGTPVLQLEVIPDVAALTTAMETPVLQFPIVPDVAALTTAMETPVLQEGVVPDPASLTATTSTPVLQSGIVPDAVVLATTPFDPVLGFVVVPDETALTTTMGDPVLGSAIVPETAPLILAAATPVLQTVIVPDASFLTIETFDAVVTITGGAVAVPTGTGFAKRQTSGQAYAKPAEIKLFVFLASAWGVIGSPRPKPQVRRPTAVSGNAIATPAEFSVYAGVPSASAVGIAIPPAIRVPVMNSRPILRPNPKPTPKPTVRRMISVPIPSEDNDWVCWELLGIADATNSPLMGFFDD